MPKKPSKQCIKITWVKIVMLGVGHSITLWGQMVQSLNSQQGKIL
jgi:hypothetical protein